MNIPKAIEIKELFYKGYSRFMTQEEVDAENLSIEALIFYKGAKKTIEAYHGMLLPGETEED